MLDIPLDVMSVTMIVLMSVELYVMFVILSLCLPLFAVSLSCL